MSVGEQDAFNFGGFSAQAFDLAENFGGRAGNAGVNEGQSVGVFEQVGAAQGKVREGVEAREDALHIGELGRSGEEGGDGFTEDLGVVVNVSLGRRGGHEGHVVEGGHEDAAVQGGEVHVPVKFDIYGGRGFSTVAGWGGAKPVFGAATELFDDPGEVEFGDDTFHACGEAVREGDGVGVGFFSEDGRERGAHGGEGEGVSGQRPADTAHVGVFVVGGGADAGGNFCGEAVDACGEATRDGFAKGEHVGFEAVGAGVTAGAGANGVGFVNDEERPGSAGELAEGGVVARIGVDDADVGHHGFGEDAGDIAGGKGGFEGVEVVEFDDARGFGGIYGGANVARPRDGDAIFERGEGFVYTAVVAVVVGEDFVPSSDLAGEAEGETVGVGGGEGRLPVGEAKAVGEFFGDPEGVFGGEHEGAATIELGGDRGNGGRGGVAGHCARVAQAKVQVAVPVHVGKMCALRFADEDGKGTGPAHHPVHRDAIEEVGLRAFK